MATEHLREKINALTNWITNESVVQFQHECLVEAAGETTGDAQVDATMTDQARNAKAVVLACARRLTIYKDRLSKLQAELDAVKE